MMKGPLSTSRLKFLRAKTSTEKGEILERQDSSHSLGITKQKKLGSCLSFLAVAAMPFVAVTC
jgi:hypothetical protein